MSTNSDALRQTLDELRSQNRISREVSAQVTAVESMAQALDYDPSNAALWRQYRDALRELLGDERKAGSLDDDQNALYDDPPDTNVRNAPSH